MKAAMKGAAIIIWIAFCFAVVWCLRLCRAKKLQLAMIQCCYRGIARLLSLDIRVRGALSEVRPLLIASNHSSYLDIIVLGAVAPVAFTPKAEIAGWPAIGAICRLTNCVFIDRRASKTADNMSRLRAAFERGAVVSLFPEGTTSDGKRLLPFRSSFFSLAQGEAGVPIALQPATVTYNKVSGLPVDTCMRPKLAWYGDMDLVPHFKELLKLGRIDAEIIFHPLVESKEYISRKDLAIYCENKVLSAMV